MKKRTKTNSTNSSYLLGFSTSNKLGERLEEARIMYQYSTNNIINKKAWSEKLRIPYSNYIAITKGKKVISMKSGPVCMIWVFL